MKRIGMVIGLYILMTAPMNAGAVTLNVMDGQLMGAEEVIVEGISYDVQFVDGTCAGLIDGCNGMGSFLFDTQMEAENATDALLTQVFNGGVYDSTPSLTNGIENAIWGSILTAYEVVDGAFESMSAWNRLGNFSDWVVWSETYSVQKDFTIDLDRTFAVWSESATRPVPEPSTLLLLGSGLLGLIFTGRKVRRQ